MERQLEVVESVQRRSKQGLNHDSVLSAIWQSSAFPPDWKRGWSSLLGKEKGNVRMATTTQVRSTHFSVPGTVPTADESEAPH